MYSSPVSFELWLRFFETRCGTDRERIVELNLPLVRSVARRIQRKHGTDFEFDELFHSGVLGLLSAVDAYEPCRGLAFSSFAVPRIRGAILDDLRKQDASTRLSRDRKRRIKNAVRAVSARELRAPSEVETASELGIDLATLHEWKAQVRRGSEISLDVPLRPGDRAPTSLAEVVPSGAVARMERGLALEQSKARLAVLLTHLPERQRLVLHLYYYEGMQQTRIAEILGVTESRVSQIRTRTLAQLRSELTESDEPRSSTVPFGADATGHGDRSVEAA